MLSVRVGETGDVSWYAALLGLVSEAWREHGQLSTACIEK